MSEGNGSKPQQQERVFRIEDKLNGRDVPHRCYASSERALNAALLLIRWEHVGQVFTVYHKRSGAWEGSYGRVVHGIKIMQRRGEIKHD